jgi:hypothetical protein
MKFRNTEFIQTEGTPHRNPYNILVGKCEGKPSWNDNIKKDLKEKE